MRFLFSRALIVPVLVILGLLAAIGGGLDSGVVFWGMALVYWFARGWGQRRARGEAARPRPTFSAQVVANGARARQSDGASGAFSRLDPAWKDWLRREAEERTARPTHDQG
jgi:hypothetical protein